jgi:glycosyltransferase involved in cell wall biosynthesis
VTRRTLSVTTSAFPKVTVVHDYLTQRGGAERVVLAIMRAFPQATLVTSVYEPTTTFSEFRNYDVRSTWIRRIPPARRDPRLALPLLARAFSGYKLPDTDVVICSSSGWAHGIRSTAPKIVYCHNPPRWLHQTSEYAAQQSLPVRLALEVMRTRLTAWDREAASTAVTYLANSTTVQARIMKTYGRDAELLPPPIAIDVSGTQQPIPGLEPGFLLSVSRARGYKNTTLLTEAMQRLPDERLVLVGGLPARTDRRAWPQGLIGLKDLSDAELRWLYANCSALLAVSHEDFGLTPLEANAFGKPVVCLRSGGYLDTLVPGVNGVFVNTLSADGIAAGVLRLRATSFSTETILKHADRYSEATFIERLRFIARQAVLVPAGPMPGPGETIDLRTHHDIIDIRPEHDRSAVPAPRDPRSGR